MVDKQILLVLGASSDMGLDLIRKTYEDYDFIIAHYSKTKNALEHLKSQIGDKLILLQSDFLSEYEIKNMTHAICDMGLCPTHIVHFPAVKFDNKKFNKIDVSQFDESLVVSVRSLILILQEFLPTMAKRKFGKVVVLSSYVTDGMPPKYCSNYVVSKYALLGLVKSLAVEYAQFGVSINCVSPSMVNTKFVDNQPDFIKEQHAQNNPLGRNLEIDDVVPTIQYLLSVSANCINGQNILITCGE